MKLGIVSDEQFKKELDRTPSVPVPISVPVPEIVPEIEKGRGKGSKEVPESLRKLIAGEHLEYGRASAIELAKDFGISASSVSAYAKGANSTASYHNPDQTLTNYLKSRRNRITKKALRVLTHSLDSITPEKLSGIKAREASAIAKDMSTVINNMNPNEASAGANKPQFIVYAPQIRDERTFETVVVSDNY